MAGLASGPKSPFGVLKQGRGGCTSIALDNLLIAGCSCPTQSASWSLHSSSTCEPPCPASQAANGGSSTCGSCCCCWWLSCWLSARCPFSTRTGVKSRGGGQTALKTACNEVAISVGKAQPPSRKVRLHSFCRWRCWASWLMPLAVVVVTAAASIAMWRSRRALSRISLGLSRISGSLSCSSYRSDI